MEPISVLATVTGRDRPGVVAAFFAALAAHDVDVQDVEQVVIRERLVLSVLFDARGDMAAVRNSMTTAAAALGMECEVAIAGSGVSARPERPGTRHHVIVLGHPLRPGAVSHVAQRIADSGGNIESIAQLSTEPSAALDMVVRAPDPGQLRVTLVRAASESGVDIAVEPTRLRRRAKRLIMLDADAILVSEVGDDAGSMVLVPGAETFVRTLRRLGYHVGAVCSGAPAARERLRADLELGFITDRSEQAAALQRFAELTGVPASQTVAIGDGAGDVELIGAAGLGVVLNSAKAMRAGIGHAYESAYPDSLLFVLGVTREELDEAQ